MENFRKLGRQFGGVRFTGDMDHSSQMYDDPSISRLAGVSAWNTRRGDSSINLAWDANTGSVKVFSGDGDLGFVRKRMAVRKLKKKATKYARKEGIAKPRFGG